MNSTTTTIAPAAPAHLSRLCRRVALNYASTLAFILLSYWVISSLSGFHRLALQGEWQLSLFGLNTVIHVHSVFIGLMVFYAVILLPYYAMHPWMHSKSFLFAHGCWSALRRRAAVPRPTHDAMQLPLQVRLSPLTRQAGLALLLKFFFAPLMINWCLIHIANLTSSLLLLIDNLEGGLTGRALFDTSLFWATFQLILFVDTLLFTLGYIIEVPALANRIRSVEPTFLGWVVCLACYPPFNDFTGRFLEWQSSDFPHFTSDYVHLSINITLLTALALFSWASVSLGFKASNLTNRGIVTHGPYAYVRHPAYAAKNLAWWLGALPMISMMIAMQNWRGLAYSLFALSGWTAIYVLRAITEERHLLMANNGYAQYMRNVRWRFVPGLW